MSADIVPGAADRGRTGVTAARGFRVGVAGADVRGDGGSRPDIALIVSETPAVAAGVFTRNAVKAAPVVISQLHIRHGRARAIVVNSGNANACTGARGLGDALQMARAAADEVDCPPGEVLIASTGVIGRTLPMERILPGIARAGRDLGGDGEAVARAIMTTDTYPKQASRRLLVGGIEHSVGGVAKGSGMIHPDMATLLAFVTTDASLSPELARALLGAAVDISFNRISVDGDTSTNDSCMLLANGAAGGPEVLPGTEESALFGQALTEVLGELAEQIVADGEGASRTFSVRGAGARAHSQALRAARTVTTSPLVKTAIHGGDPNWGRILAAVGRSGAELALDRCRLTIQGEELFRMGQVVDGAVERVAPRLQEPRVSIDIDLGVGEAEVVALGCDLTDEYVRINADYST